MKVESNLLSIRQCVERGKAEGLPIPEVALRRWVKSGAVRAIYAGRKALIFWPNLVRFITSGDQSTVPTHDDPAA